MVVYRKMYYMNSAKAKKRFTKRPMVLCSVRISVRDKDLWQAAAAQEEETQSQFLREAIIDRARRVLLAYKGEKDSIEVAG